MKTILLLSALVALISCAAVEITPEEKNESVGKSSQVTWELVEIRNLAGEWRNVSSNEKHYLTFVTDSLFEYSDANTTCGGSYLFEIIANSIPADRLTLKAPCMVSAQQLWWEHMIEVKTEHEVITNPHLANTAYMSSERFKYRIKSSAN